MSAAKPSIAEAFVAARLGAWALGDFPGNLPQDLDAAYAVQAECINMWPDQIAGWKVARIAPPLASVLGADRWIGPIFRAAICKASSGINPFPVIAGGGGALEGEIMLVLAEDAPKRSTPWTAAAARDLVGEVRIGVEVAGSPFAGNSALGPIAMVCSVGNSLGLIVGPQIAGDLGDGIPCTVTIDGLVVGSKAVDGDLSGPLEALAFTLEASAALGFPLRAGQIVSTGAITGAHGFAIGQHGRVDYGRFGRIDCHAVAAEAFDGIDGRDNGGDLRHGSE